MEPICQCDKKYEREIMILRSLKAPWKDFPGCVQFVLRENNFFREFSPTSVNASQLVEYLPSMHEAPGLIPSTL